MTTLKTATGKEFDSDYFVQHEPSNSLYFAVNTTFETAETVFSNPEETAKLEYVGRVYEGFTTLARIEQKTDSIKMRLIKDG